MADYKNKIRDNSKKRGSVYSFLKEVLNNNFEKYNDKSKLKIVSAYFTIYAFEKLKEELTNQVSEVKFILGEPSSIENLSLKNKRFKTFKIQDEDIKLSNIIQQNKVAKDCYNWLKQSNIEIRTAPKKDDKKTLIHGKMYHIEQCKNDYGVEAIIGSSNFTNSGLGIEQCSNYELNTIINDRDDINDLKEWFNELWENNTEDAKSEILSYIESIYKENSPEQVYYKTLYHLFEEKLEEEQENVENNKNFTQTKIWNMLYQFQRDAVNSIVKRLDQYNGCILADSVGLGKTYTALGVIQYFICTKRPNILVLAPKRLAGNWNIYERNHPNNIFDDDNLNISFVSHSELTSKNIDKDMKLWNFDLVVIDESHNFRNATPSKKDETGSVIKISRYDKLLNKVLKEGSRQPKVLLLSATPVNTNLTTDLNNQIRLITLDNDNAFSSSKSLNIQSVEGTLKTAKKAYIEWATKKNRDKKDLLNKLNSNFFKLMNNLTIARSRNQIKSGYDNNNKIGKFPKRKNPVAKCIDIDIEEKFPTFAEIDNRISDYSLSLFKPSKYLKDKKEAEKIRGNMTQEDRENYLIGMMKAGFLKRLESSIASFTISMKNTIDKIDNRIELIDKYKKSSQDMDITADFEDDILEINDDDDLNDKIDFTVGKKLKYSLSELNVDWWREELIEDRKKIEEIYNISKEITAERDKKLRELKTIITEKSKQKNKKIILFTTYADTAIYLYNSLKDYIYNELNLNTALVTGKKDGTKTTYGKSDFNDILSNFSPCSKLKEDRTGNNQIDILFATDCVSEGQNLQDCDMVINYDIHWNPVRLIQRYGRIDRIGSLNDYIRMICFWPTESLDEYINLKNRVEARAAMADIAASADDNPLEKQEEDNAQARDLTYRDIQLKQIRDEKPIDDIDENNALLNMADFSLEDFRKDLKDFVDTKKDDLKSTPNGIYAVVPNNTNNDSQKYSKGVIFCLKQKSKSKENTEHNELYPYYLVYVKEDGTILYTYKNAREILSIYKNLCLGKKEPFFKLCKKFNDDIETKEGSEFYNKLLKATTESLKKTYAEQLFKPISTRGGLIPTEDEQLKSEDDLELITWLIITEGEE